jgi:hypothetical protein
VYSYFFCVLEEYVENTRKVFQHKWRICHIRVICGAQNCLQICGRYSNRFGEIQRKNLSVYGGDEKRLLTYFPNLPRDKRKSVYISVLIHLDQHFMERGLCRSERERTLEIIDSGHIIRWLSPSILFTLIRTPGVTCCYLPLLQTVFRARVNRQRVHQAATSCLFDPEIRGREQCLRGSQEIYSLQEILEINTNNKNQELISKG